MDPIREKLVQQIREASDAWQALHDLPAARHASIQECVSAAGRIREAERALAAFDGEQYAVPLDLGFHPDSGVSAPLLLQTDDCAILTFSATTNFVVGSYTTGGTAVVELDSC